MSVFHFRKSDWAYRSRAEYVSQIISDIASNYGYNEFLAEKLFHLFAVNEVGSGARGFLVRIYTHPVSGNRVLRIKRNATTCNDPNEYITNSTKRFSTSTHQSWCQLGANRKVVQGGFAGI